MSFIKKTDSMEIIAIILSAISLILLVQIFFKLTNNKPKTEKVIGEPVNI